MFANFMPVSSTLSFAKFSRNERHTDDVLAAMKVPVHEFTFYLRTQFLKSTLPPLLLVTHLFSIVNTYIQNIPSYHLV